MRSLLLLPLLAAMGCGGEDPSTPEGIAAAQTAAMHDLVDIVEGIRNKADVESAKTRVEEIARRMQAAWTAAEKLGPEERKRLDDRLKAESETIEPRMEKAMERLDTEARVALGGLLTETASKARR